MNIFNHKNTIDALINLSTDEIISNACLWLYEDFKSDAEMQEQIAHCAVVGIDPKENNATVQICLQDYSTVLYKNVPISSLLSDQINRQRRDLLKEYVAKNNVPTTKGIWCKFCQCDREATRLMDDYGIGYRCPRCGTTEFGNYDCLVATCPECEQIYVDEISWDGGNPSVKCPYCATIKTLEG